MRQRFLDVLVASVLLVVTSPVMVIAATTVALTSPGPILYRATRVGAGGNPFVLLKFRSMYIDNDGPGITVGGDHRITPVGRLLRRSKLDELPQLWNVLRGDMSIVGPRPEDPRYLPWYDSGQRRLFEWRPGITSPGSIAFRDEETRLATLLADGRSLEEAYKSVLAEKAAIDLGYFDVRSNRSDIAWMFRTIFALARR